MGILKYFLRYKIKMARCSRRYSPSRGAVENCSGMDINSLGKFFDSSSSSDHHHNKDGANSDDDKIIKDDFVNVRSFSWDEITKATMDFSQVIGYGGFSNVYLAHFPPVDDDDALTPAAAAIKSHTSTTQRLYQVFKQELEILLHLNHNHDRVVSLLGFYDDQEKGVLVFEYMENGSLQEKLHQADDDGGYLVLSWRKRMQIAYQVGQAIEYLHDECIVHGDIKSSNILLDNNFDSKLCDFGSAKKLMGTTGVSSSALANCKRQHQHRMMGSPGYVDPYYLKTGIASKKNDIYSFGVLLLELITGMEPFSP